MKGKGRGRGKGRRRKRGGGEEEGQGRRRQTDRQTDGKRKVKRCHRNASLDGRDNASYEVVLSFELNDDPPFSLKFANASFKERTVTFVCATMKRDSPKGSLNLMNAFGNLFSRDLVLLFRKFIFVQL